MWRGKGGSVTVIEERLGGLKARKDKENVKGCRKIGGNAKVCGGKHRRMLKLWRKR